MSEWEIQVKAVRKELKTASSRIAIEDIWRKNLNLGHRTLGRLLIGTDAQVERLIDKKDEQAQLSSTT